MRKTVILFLISMCILTQAAFAYTAKLARVEKLFLEGNYEYVINESAAYIRSGAGQKDELYYLKGLSELKTSRFDDARSSFNTIIAKYPYSKKLFDAYLGFGDSHLLGGNPGNALGVYNMMAEKFPSDTNIAIVYSRMASCYTQMGLREKADYYTAMAKQCSPFGFEAKAGPVKVASSPGAVKVSAPPQQTVHISGSAVSFGGSEASGLDTGRISIQVGSFKSKRNADNFVQKLSAAGYRSFVTIPVSSRDKFYRVKVGKFNSKDEASKVAGRLAGDGYNTTICTDDVCE